MNYLLNFFLSPKILIKPAATSSKAAGSGIDGTPVYEAVIAPTVPVIVAVIAFIIIVPIQVPVIDSVWVPNVAVTGPNISCGNTAKVVGAADTGTVAVIPGEREFAKVTIVSVRLKD